MRPTSFLFTSLLLVQLAACGKKEEPDAASIAAAAAAAAARNSAEIDPVAATLAGIVIVLGIFWQVVLWSRWLEVDSNDREKAAKAQNAIAVGLLLPIAVAVMLALGIAVIGSVALSDTGNRAFTATVFFAYIGKAIVLVLVTAAKAAAGILVAAYVISAEIYFYFTYGQLRPVPIIGAILDWIFNFGPGWIGTVWLGAQVSWSVITGTLYTVASAKA